MQVATCKAAEPQNVTWHNTRSDWHKKFDNQHELIQQLRTGGQQEENGTNISSFYRILSGNQMTCIMFQITNITN